MNLPVMTGDELFKCDSMLMDVTVKDFWAWAMSRLIADGPRGDLAEFIVNTALGIDTTIAKHGWGEYDILYDGIRIEVKSSSVIQAWERHVPSKPIFSIAKTKSSDVDIIDNTYIFIGRSDDDPIRRSDVYVFCLFDNPVRETANPMDLDQWKFYVVPTSVINDKCGNHKTISVKGIEKLGASAICYSSIKSTVDSLIKEYNIQKTSE